MDEDDPEKVSQIPTTPAANRIDLESLVTPAQLAAQIGCSERYLKNRARAIGACREFGKFMVLLPEDVQAILEAAKPCPRVTVSSSTRGARPGITVARSPGRSFEKLQARLMKLEREG